MVIKGSRNSAAVQPVAKPAKSTDKKKPVKKGPGKGQDIYEVSIDSQDPKQGE